MTTADDSPLNAEESTTSDDRLIPALKALSAQASNAAYFLEHRDDAELIALLADAGKTVDQRATDCIDFMRWFQNDVEELLTKRDTKRTP